MKLNVIEFRHSFWQFDFASNCLTKSCLTKNKSLHVFSDFNSDFSALRNMNIKKFNDLACLGDCNYIFDFFKNCVDKSDIYVI